MIHQRLFNVEISFASNSFIIKDNIIKSNYISLESLNLPFNYPYFNFTEKLIKSYNDFDVNLSASIYFKSTFLFFIPLSCNFALIDSSDETR